MQKLSSECRGRSVPSDSWQRLWWSVCAWVCVCAECVKMRERRVTDGTRAETLSPAAWNTNDSFSYNSVSVVYRRKIKTHPDPGSITSAEKSYMTVTNAPAAWVISSCEEEKMNQVGSLSFLKPFCLVCHLDSFLFCLHLCQLLSSSFFGLFTIKVAPLYDGLSWRWFLLCPGVHGCWTQGTCSPIFVCLSRGWVFRTVILLCFVQWQFWAIQLNCSMGHS